MNLIVEPTDILRFWFEELNSNQWFKSTAELDEEIRTRFLASYEAASRCELQHWRTAPEGRLAEIIVLDQFSRNLFRDQAAAFASDPAALILAQEAVAADMHLKLQAEQRAFMLMPFMHSESLLIHEQAIVLFDQPGLESNLHAERWHKELIERFGRYPARNAALGRESTKEEKAYLAKK